MTDEQTHEVRSQELLRAPVWVRDEQRRRTALTREAIVRAAIVLADAEGLDAVSIRRVASELQARAMSLYTYIERKEDLFDLMADEVAAEVLVPGELPRDWREATVLIARREREATRRHPWMIDLVARRSMAGHVGPNMLRHLDQTLAALAHLDAGQDAKLRLAAVVSDYTTGFVVREAREHEAAREDREGREGLASYLRRIADSGEYPHIAPLLGSGLSVGSIDTFDSGLVWILDGFAHQLERPAPASPSPAPRSARKPQRAKR